MAGQHERVFRSNRRRTAFLNSVEELRPSSIDRREPAVMSGAQALGRKGGEPQDLALTVKPSWAGDLDVFLSQDTQHAFTYNVLARDLSRARTSRLEIATIMGP